MATDRTNAERQKRWRDRQAGKLPAAPKISCAACGKIHTGARGQYCSRCWEKETVEGRAFKAARVARARARRKAQSTK